MTQFPNTKRYEKNDDFHEPVRDVRDVRDG